MPSEANLPYNFRLSISGIPNPFLRNCRNYPKIESMRLLNELNNEQRRAVEATSGPVLIVAGPGTGKTKTLTARIAFLLEKGVRPSEILALTFTNKAAREMRERLAKLLPDVDLPKVTTFHALGHELLKGENERKLISAQEQQEILRSLPKPRGSGLTIRDLSLIISRAKTSLTLPKDEITKNLLEKYEAILTEKNLYDFDDLLCKSYELLQANEAERPKYNYVLVDEFQDTSELQYELLKLLTDAQNIFAIGDPNQSIYAFRGAGAEMFERFRCDFPEVKTIELVDNYRSALEIVSLANAIFSDSPQLNAQSKTSGIVRAVQALNEYGEAAYALGEIEKGIGGSDMLKAHADDTAAQPRDYAMLYRTHRAAKTLQKLFAESGVPYQIAGEGSPYEKPVIQTLIAALRYLQNPAENAPPKLKNLTQMQIKTLLETIKIPDEKTVCDLAAEVAKTLGLSDEYVATFCGHLVQFGAGRAALQKALAHIDAIAESEFYDPTVNAVTLMTIHASKGLEFEHVFLIAAEEGVLPKMNKSGDTNIDEEKRLFYVAATRAKQSLEILHAKFRAGESAKPSRFIQEILDQTLPKTQDPDLENQQRKAKKRAAKRAQTSLF